MNYVTLEDAAKALRVKIAVLKAFIETGNAHIDQVEKGGVRRFLFAHLKHIQDKDPTFGGLKRVSKQLTAPVSAFAQEFVDAKLLFVTTVFLASVDLHYAAAFAVGTSGAVLARKVAQSEERKRDATAAIDLFRSYFGLHDYSCDLGKTYPYGGFHRDHAAAFTRIMGEPGGVVMASDSASVIMPPNDNHLLIGGPVSTPTVRKVWQYERGRLGTSLQRVSEPLLPLPCSFLVDDNDERMKLMHKVAWRVADGSENVSVSLTRPLLNMHRPNQLLIPELSSDHFYMKDGKRVYLPETNYLIITRIPNFLSRAFQHAKGRDPALWGRLVSIQATNGIGTRAAGLLLTEKGKEPLLAMKNDVGDAEAFQAIFLVSKPEEDWKGVDDFTKIEYRQSVVLDIALEKYTLIRNLICCMEGYSAFL